MKLLEYLETTFDTFDDRPFCPADSLVLTQLAMIEAPGALPAPGVRAVPVGPRDLLLAERFDTMFLGLEPSLVKRALFAAAASPRFRELALSDYVSVFDARREVQFAALSFTWRDRFTYVAFRGTDASFTGWREDFNMGWTWPVPGQTEAVTYLRDIARTHASPLIVGGHSKGGNLAVYAAVKSPPNVQDRIALVYNHDGPGFRPEAFANEEYARIADRVHKTVPVESVVGVLLETRDDFGVVESSGHGIDQHSLFNWEIDPVTGDFSYARRLSDASAFWRETMAAWVRELSVQEIRRIVDALFDTLEASGEQDAAAVLGGGPKALGVLIDAARNVDPDDRAVLTRAFGSLGGAAARTLRARWGG